MQDVLLHKLIEKNFFITGTKVDAMRKGVDLSGQPMHQFGDTFTVVGLATSQKTGRLLVEVVSSNGDLRRRLTADQIINIDGMTPERFAENYMIAPDGSDIKVVGRRRGRRPKNWTEEDEEEEYLR